MRNKILKALITLITVVFLGLAAGCGGGGSDATSSSGDSTTGNSTTGGTLTGSGQ